MPAPPYSVAEQPDVGQRELTGAVVLLGTGRDLLLRDPPRHVLDHQLLFAELEIHGMAPSDCKMPILAGLENRSRDSRRDSQLHASPQFPVIPDSPVIPSAARDLL